MKLKKKLMLLTFVVFVSSIFFMSCDARLLGLMLSKKTHDFGRVNIGDATEFTLQIDNVSSLQIKINNIAINGSQDFRIISGDTQLTMQAQSKHQIVVEFRPTVAGKLLGVLSVYHTGPGATRVCNLSGTGVPVPRIQLSETDYDFGTVGLTLTDTHDFQIENIGTADLNIASFNFVNHMTLYSITNGGAIPIIISPGAIHVVTVQFAPATVGDFDTMLNITHNGVNEMSPMEIEIKGAGGGGKLDLNQNDPWDVGLVKVNSTKALEIELKNGGTIDLNINGIQMLTSSEYRIDNIVDSNGTPINTPFALSVQDYAVVTINFTPPTVTNYNDTLSIDHDGSYSPSPKTVTLNGTGRNPISQVFNYTGSAQNWNVPAGLTGIEVDGYGGEGGDGYSAGLHFGGKGGRTQATLTVTPGAALNVYVGQKGVDAAYGSPGAGGWNGGGRGSQWSAGPSYCGGGGGGASDIRSGGTALSDRIYVAGGGGGAAFNYYAGGDDGGKGGGLTGGAGCSNHMPNGDPGYCGQGGTQTSGGQSAGMGGTPGMIGVGGNGSETGGGGGGGLYGGGGGHFGGAGGGSSFTAVGSTAVTHTQGIRTNDGEITIKY